MCVTLVILTFESTLLKSRWVAGGAGLACWWCWFSNTNACRWGAGGGGLTCWWCGFSNTNASRRVEVRMRCHLCPIIAAGPYRQRIWRFTTTLLERVYDGEARISSACTRCFSAVIEVAEHFLNFADKYREKWSRRSFEFELSLSSELSYIAFAQSL